MSAISIGIDLGGTRIKGVAIDKDGGILQQEYTPTRDGDSVAWKNGIAGTVRNLQESLQLNDYIVGISAPGIPNQQNNAIAYMPGRLQGLENFDWSVFFQRPVVVLNDAIAALVAESRFGAAKGKKNVVLLTLGTGVGGAIMIDGKPYQGNFNKAGHLGHIVIDSTGDPDVTGMPGSLEDAIGNVTVSKRSMGKFESTHELLQAYRSGDEFAGSVWLTSVQKLAIGMASIINILSPDCIILAGGITEAGDDLFNPLRQFMDRYEWRMGGLQTEIVKAAFGDMAGAIGAACFAQENRKFEE